MTLSAIAASILATGEVVILCLGGFVLFRHWGNSVSESYAYALITPLMLLSALFQLAFIAGIPFLAASVEILLTLLSAATVYRLRAVLGESLAAGRGFVAANPISTICIFVLGLYLLLSAWVLPPESEYWPALATVARLQQSGSVLAALSPALPAAANSPLPPLNAAILAHLFLRFGSDFGVGLFGFMAYLSIGFTTYALARRYAWPPTAFTVALMVAAMPRIVLLATTPGIELLPAAAALFCLLAVYRAIEHPNRRDLFLLLVGLLFTISGSPMDAAFPAVMIPLSALLLFRRHGFITWWNLLRSRLVAIPIALAALILFSQLWLALLNHAHLGRWFGSTDPGAFIFNADGIQGALANLARYVFNSAHFTRPLDLICSWAFGFTLSGALQRFYEFLIDPLFANLGAAAEFAITWLPDERIAWFGPFGFLLVLPAVAYAALRAPRRLKAVAVGLAGYFFLVVLIAAWCPGNARFFTIFFVCSGFTIALFLPPWYISPAGRRRLQEISILLLLYASAFNLLRPVVALPEQAAGATAGRPSCSDPASRPSCGPTSRPDNSVWIATAWGRNRLEPSTRTFGDRRIADTAALVPENAPLHLVCRRPQMAYPFMMAFPQAAVLQAPVPDDHPLWKPGKGPDRYVLFVDHDPPEKALPPSAKVLWKADRLRSACGGALIRVK